MGCSQSQYKIIPIHIPIFPYIRFNYLTPTESNIIDLMMPIYYFTPFNISNAELFVYLHIIKYY
jgi:hypothetical protein